MTSLTNNEVTDFISGKKTGVPLCSICTEKKCFIFLENDQKYYYTYTCSLCVDKIERKYITDVELYKFLHHNEAPLCVSCHKQKCFIRVGKKGYFFSNKCSSCMGVRI